MTDWQFAALFCLLACLASYAAWNMDDHADLWQMTAAATLVFGIVFAIIAVTT